jgi:hypothetical protein
MATGGILEAYEYVSDGFLGNGAYGVVLKVRRKADGEVSVVRILLSSLPRKFNCR